jgi:hypothetical protein
MFKQLVWYESARLRAFDESYTYKGYALVNEIYKDEDHQANTWLWGKLDGDSIVDAKLLTGLSSNSYASWEEVQRVFETIVDEINKE